MNYKTIKMEYHYKKDRFNRTIMVRDDINLIELGCVMCTALRTEFEHCFLFLKGKRQYSPECFIENAIDDGIDEVPMKNYKLLDLGDKFQFWYDTGENWLFDCEVSKKEKNVIGNELAYLIDGKGQGVWEDNVCSLRMYFDGEVDPESNEEDESKGLYMPWNFENEKYSDFDTKFDLVEEKELFLSKIYGDIEMYLEQCHEYGHELEIEPRTEEFLEYDDYSEPEDGEINMHLNSIILKVVDEQIKTVDYVKKKYQELLKKYDDFTARNMIGVVLTEEIYTVMSENKPSDQKAYQKKIEKLK